jgi:hypothetical protein
LGTTLGGGGLVVAAILVRRLRRHQLGCLVRVSGHDLVDVLLAPLLDGQIDLDHVVLV